MQNRRERTDRKDRAERRERQERQVYTAEYKVARSDTLLEFLLKKCNTSRNNVKTLLTNGYVSVDGSVVTRHDFPLAKDDEVKISKTRLSAPKTASVRTPKKRPLPIKILYEDDDFIAVDKPAGLLSVESDKERECAFAYVFEYLRASGKRPYILHRIDKETSGVLVFAKNIKLHSMLKMKWNDYVTKREYHAVVEGKLPKKSDTLIAYLKENQNNLVYVSHVQEGQRAVTRYTVLKESEKYSLLKVEIDTGRKNQIRVQMKELSHAVVGDEKYGAAENPLGRLGLHASALSFTHPTKGTAIELSSPPPPSFFGLFGK